ncbi:MAG: vWA domain-containing protein [Pyrinomonadaceae bacterium]
MKRFFTVLLLLTFATAVFAENSENEVNKTITKKLDLEMVFVVDTTGSMGGLIEGAKTKIWSIVNRVMSGKEKPNVKIGLVAYRDNQDMYVTKIYPLTEDLDSIYTALMEFRAQGGGDLKENVRRGLADGVYKTGWSKPAKNLKQIIFLVGDAPPHDDYPQEPDVLETTEAAVKKNMIINTIQCGDVNGTKEIWQKIALNGEGKYFSIAQDGGVNAIETPYDKDLAVLGNQLGGTFLAYGGGAGATGKEYRANAKKKQNVAELTVLNSAPATAAADRALNKTMNSVAYVDDLLQAIENKTVKLEDVKEEDLPDEIKPLSAEERKAEIERRLSERKEIRAKIVELSKKRDAYITVEAVKQGKQDGFDAAVEIALSEQIERP